MSISISGAGLFNAPDLRSTEASIAFFQLSRLLMAGVSLADALHDLASAETSRQGRHLWRSIEQAVCSGQSLSQALGLIINKRENTVLAMLRAGESNAQLGSACNAVYEYLQWQRELRQRLLTVLIYPLFSLAVLAGVTGFLFVSVVPAIERFLVSSDGGLEWHTVALIGVSSWMSQHYLSILLGATLLVIGLVLLFFSSQVVRRFVDRWTLALPVLGGLITDLSLSRYAQCCAQLYASGVALEKSMELAENTVSNNAMKSSLADARLWMVGGMSLAQAMQKVSFMPAVFTRLIAVGESSGQLAQTLMQVGEQQSSAANASIKRMEQLIGPVLMMFVGSVLVWLVVSVLGPVYNLAIATVVAS